jgi:hypothetical protein
VPPPRSGAARLCAALSLASASPLIAQATATLDVGASAVRYDGFLGSGAAYVAPSLRFNTQRLSLGAQGTFLLFESGNRILQGTAAGAWLTPLTPSWRLELSGSSGISAYESFPAYGHVLARARLHAVGRQIGGWLAASAGRSFARDTVVTPFEMGAGGWAVWGRIGTGLAVHRRRLADSAYVDVMVNASLRDPYFTVEATLGARPWSRGPPEGLYGELSAEVPVASHAALIVSGGRYPADPVRGVIGARYVSVAVRLSALGTVGVRAPVTMTTAPANDDPVPPDRVGLTALPVGGGHWTMRVRAAGASQVELAADFTDWQARELVEVRAGVWELTVPLDSGIYRLNVRIDGGAWIVPLGLRTRRDDFGGAVGILVIRR